MSIADKKKLENLGEYLEAEREVDRLWNKPDDGKMNRLAQLMLDYEAENEESLTQLLTGDPLWPEEEDEGEDFGYLLERF